MFPLKTTFVTWVPCRKMIIIVVVVIIIIIIIIIIIVIIHSHDLTSMPVTVTIFFLTTPTFSSPAE